MNQNTNTAIIKTIKIEGRAIPLRERSLVCKSEVRHQGIHKGRRFVATRSCAVFEPVYFDMIVESGEHYIHSDLIAEGTNSGNKYDLAYPPGSHLVVPTRSAVTLKSEWKGVPAGSKVFCFSTGSAYCEARFAVQLPAA